MSSCETKLLRPNVERNFGIQYIAITFNTLRKKLICEILIVQQEKTWLLHISHWRKKLRKALSDSVWLTVAHFSFWEKKSFFLIYCTNKMESKTWQMKFVLGSIVVFSISSELYIYSSSMNEWKWNWAFLDSWVSIFTYLFW